MRLKLLLVLAVHSCGCSSDSDSVAPGGNLPAASGGDAAQDGSNPPARDIGHGGSPEGSRASPVDCTALPVCEDFESSKPGAAPSSDVWTTELNYANNGAASLVAVSTEAASSGAQSLKVEPPDGQPYGFWTQTSASRVYVRARIKLASAQPGVLLAVGTSGGHDAEIRLRLRDGALTLNAVPGDGLNPDPATCGDCSIPSEWFCAEMFVDPSSQDATLWVDGEELARIENNQGWHSDGTTFPQTLERIWFGSISFDGGAGPTVYFDDIAVGADRIGCD